MMNEPLITNKLLYRRYYNDNATILIQLFLIALLILDYTFGSVLIHRTGNWFYSFFLIAVALILVPKLKILSFLNKETVLTALYHIMISLFIVLAAPLNSVYEIAILHAFFEAVYWFGFRGFIASYLFFATILELNYIVNFDDRGEHAFYVLVIKLLLLAIFGGLLARLVAAQQKERQHIIDMSQKVGFERERLHSLINSMADAVIATDKEGRIVLYNGAALDLINTNVTLDNQKLSTIIDAYDADKHRVDIIGEANESAGTILKRDDLMFENTDGDIVNIYVSLSRIHLGYESSEQGFICLLRDITKEKSIEEQRDEFISVVSHELRTPIAIAEANVSTTMLPSILSDEKKAEELLKQAHNNIVFLAAMVNDITTLAHAERGDLTAEIEKVDPVKLVGEVHKTYLEEAKSQKLELINKAADKKLPSFNSNNYRIKEIMQDFVTNSLKYTEKGSVTLDVEMMPDGRYKFSVTDTGIGLSANDRKHVFEKFWRSEDYRTKTHKGTGLGLHIAQKLAERMKGELGLDSKLNEGSTFFLLVPSLKKPVKRSES